eukprot:COSAG03_NODE_5937_length_1144_cov_2693.794258_3_plen_24_part_01
MLCALASPLCCHAAWRPERAAVTL